MKQIGEIKLFESEEISEKLELNIQTVRRLIRTGVIKGKKLGGRWHVTEQALREYFEMD